jgi:hypothetical protein
MDQAIGHRDGEDLIAESVKEISPQAENGLLEVTIMLARSQRAETRLKMGLAASG